MFLVIGYGNELRSDDGAGPRVARTVAGWNVRGVLSVALPQLTPELAEAVAGADEVFFVDAAGGEVGVGLRPVRPDGRRPALDHASSPPALLALAEAVYGRRPRAWLMTLPAPDLDFGEELSPAAARGVDEALRCICWHIVT